MTNLIIKSPMEGPTNVISFSLKILVGDSIKIIAFIIEPIF